MDFGLFNGREIWRSKKWCLVVRHWCRILQMGPDNLPRSFIITQTNAHIIGVKLYYNYVYNIYNYKIIIAIII